MPWKAGIGYSDHAADDGEDSAFSANTPLVMPDGPFNRWTVLREFQRTASGLDPAVAAFVTSKLAAYRPPTV